jgi:hypothetical protein
MTAHLRRRAALGLAAALAFASSTLTPARGATSALSLPSVKHVFVIVLENKDFDKTFGSASPAPYLSKTLPSQGQLLTQYYGIGHVSLDNYIAMISGQAPNAATQGDCIVYQDFAPPIAVIDANGQAIGQGCVLPATVSTLANQLDASGRSWRGYMEDMKTPCRHPALNTQDTTQSAKVGDQYATRHNPFMYFHSIIDDNASCQRKVVDLAQLPTDLASVDTTPNFSFITPDLCHDGHDAPCVDQQPGGLVSSDAFLRDLVPKILDSPAYKQDGLLLIAFDEAEVGNPASATACCGETPGPNSAMPGIDGPGGGRVGGVVLSQFTAPGTINDTPYNHYSLLRSLEDMFGVPHLGFAAASGLRAFGPDVFNAATQTTSTPATTPPGAASGSSLPRTGGSSPAAWAAAAILFTLAGARVRRRGGTLNRAPRRYG